MSWILGAPQVSGGFNCTNIQNKLTRNLVEYTTQKRSNVWGERERERERNEGREPLMGFGSSNER